MESDASPPAAGDGATAAAASVPTTSSSASSSSVEALLSVPLDLILRELPTPPASAAATAATAAPRRRTRRRTLLSRSEAAALLRVTQLSIEQDALVRLAADVLANAHLCSTLRLRIEDSCRVLYGSRGDSSNNASANNRSEESAPPPVRYPRHLLALLPILSVHADAITDRTVRHVQAQSQRILTELAQCAATLRQCAEHNWTVSEHLLVDVGDAAMGGARGGGGADGTAAGSNVGRDKESLAEIEEAVCDRIEGLICMAVDTGSSSNNSGGSDNAAAGSPTSSRKRKRGAEDARGAIPQDVFDVSVDYTTGEFVSMAELCCRLFPYLRDGVAQEVEGNTGGRENISTAGGGGAADNADQSTLGVEPMDVDKHPNAGDSTNGVSSPVGSTAPSAINEPGLNKDARKASESSSANNIDSSGAESSGNDDDDYDADNGREMMKKTLPKMGNEKADLRRDASSSSSPSQSQMNAAAALAVLAST